MGTYTITGWYAAEGSNVKVSETISADSDAAARETAREMFGKLNEGGGYGYSIRDQNGRTIPG